MSWVNLECPIFSLFFTEKNDIIMLDCEINEILKSEPCGRDYNYKKLSYGFTSFSNSFSFDIDKLNFHSWYHGIGVYRYLLK